MHQSAFLGLKMGHYIFWLINLMVDSADPFFLVSYCFLSRKVCGNFILWQMLMTIISFILNHIFE